MVQMRNRCVNFWEGIYSSGQFNEDALDYYFDEWVDRFFLLGGEAVLPGAWSTVCGVKAVFSGVGDDCGRAQA